MKFLAQALGAASFAALAIAPAAAEPVRLTIDTADLDLHSQTGAERLAHRIEAQVEKACERPFIRDLKAMRTFEECVSSAHDVTGEPLALSASRPAA